MKPPKKEKPFPTEAALCARFIAALPPEWIPYAETAGWDILLVRKADGFQIGIQAKLKLNAHVVAQTIEEGRGYQAVMTGPDCRAVLVPNDDAGPFDTIAGYIGFTIIRVRNITPERRGQSWRGFYNQEFSPQLPPQQDPHGWSGREWFECAPTHRHKLPEYIPDVAAGSSAPLQLTTWKIAAIKIAVTLEKRGFLMRADFKHHGIDYRRWIAAESGWLKVSDGRYLAGGSMPNFKKQHPKVYAQIASESSKWMLKELADGARLI